MKRDKTIGFIGRIHKDRGIWEFIQLVKKLNSQNKTFKIVIAGNGPHKNEFLNQLYMEVPKSRISYLGQLPQEELAKVWKQIGVLVSMAPVESYGRVMREALVAGVPVWATKSSGVKDLMDKCEKGTVKILDLNKSAFSLNQDFEILLKTKVSSKFGKEFIKENNTYAAKLAQSWVKVISQSKQK
jgi:glycosyltransferase involved in cell wall biosynthesis